MARAITWDEWALSIAKHSDGIPVYVKVDQEVIDACVAAPSEFPVDPGGDNSGAIGFRTSNGTVAMYAPGSKLEEMLNDKEDSSEATD